MSPPLKSIVNTNTNMKPLRPNRSRRDSGYAASRVRVTLMVVPTVA